MNICRTYIYTHTCLSLRQELSVPSALAHGPCKHLRGTITAMFTNILPKQVPVRHSHCQVHQHTAGVSTHKALSVPRSPAHCPSKHPQRTVTATFISTLPESVPARHSHCHVHQPHCLSTHKALPVPRSLAHGQSEHLRGTISATYTSTLPE